MNRNDNTNTTGMNQYIHLPPKSRCQTGTIIEGVQLQNTMNTQNTMDYQITENKFHFCLSEFVFLIEN